MRTPPRQIGWSTKSYLLWIISQQFEQLISLGINFFHFETEITYYVRPSGTTYGTGDGSSYANAWSGFSAINWSKVTGNKLAVCGTHLQALIVGASNVKIYGNNSNGAGIIDGTNTIVSNITVLNYVNVYFEGFTSLRATTDGIFIRGTADVTTKNCTFSQTGNQGIQHYENAIGRHYNPLCENNADDGISGHDDTTIYVYGGNLNNNAEGINIIKNVRCYAYGVSFSGNTLNDVRAISADITEQCILEISDSTMNIADVSTNAKLKAFNCTIANLKVGAGIVRSYFEGTNCDIDIVNNTNLVDETFTNCNINNLVKPATSSTNVIRFYNSYCKIQVNFNYTGIFIARRSFFDTTGSAFGVLDMQSGSTTDLAYCILKNPVSAKFALTFRAGSIISRVDNCTFDCVNAGNAIFSLVAKTFNNPIFYRHVSGVQASGVTLVLNNACFNSGTTNTISTVTQNNSQTGSPNFVNPATNDYRLGVGSSCLNTGITAVETQGLLTAVWSGPIPIVTEIAQSGAWDIGAMIQ